VATARRKSTGRGPQIVHEQAEGELEAAVSGAGDQLGGMAASLREFLGRQRSVGRSFRDSFP